MLILPPPHTDPPMSRGERVRQHARAENTRRDAVCSSRHDGILPQVIREAALSCPESPYPD